MALRELPEGVVWQHGMTLEDVRVRVVISALKATNGNRTVAAKMLGVSQRMMRNYVRKYRHQYPDIALFFSNFPNLEK